MKHKGGLKPTLGRMRSHAAAVLLVSAFCTTVPLGAEVDGSDPELHLYGFSVMDARNDLLAELIKFHRWLLKQGFRPCVSPRKENVATPDLFKFWYQGETPNGTSVKVYVEVSSESSGGSFGFRAPSILPEEEGTDRDAFLQSLAEKAFAIHKTHMEEHLRTQRD